MSKINISVVVPCFEEMANLQKGVLDKMIHFLEKSHESYEIIVVDDGSKDGSVEFLEEFIKDNPEVSLFKNKHTGKAGAVTTGMLKARGKYVLFTDMDQATPIEEMRKLMPFFEKGYDVVIGSRNNKRRGSPFIRRFISRANVILRKLLVGLPEISDTQCGFKMFKAAAASGIFQKIDFLHHGFRAISNSSVTSEFDLEILLLAKNLGYEIYEVPVSWLYVETRRVNPIRDSFNGVMGLLRIRMNLFRGLYK